MIRVVGKGRTVDFARDDLQSMRTASEGTLVDVGTGDAKFPYAVAGERPRWLVVGIDALDAPMEETAAKGLRKPAKGGRSNLVLLRASVEAMPPELDGIADEVSVVLPWGRLLEGLVLGDAAVVGGLAAIMAEDARIAVTLNGEIWVDSLPNRYADLPVPTPEYVTEVVVPAFAAARVDVDVDEVRVLSASDAKSIATTWARKLGHGRAHPTFVHFEGVRRAD
jgi:16S rRNA (adenine(1408)-N(1))-methyltransferase